MSIVIFSKYDGRPFLVNADNAKWMLRSGQFLSLNYSHLVTEGVDDHVEKSKLRTKGHEKGDGEMQHVGLQPRSESTQAQHDNQVVANPRQETSVTPIKRSRGRPKLIKVVKDEKETE